MRSVPAVTCTSTAAKNGPPGLIVASSQAMEAPYRRMQPRDELRWGKEERRRALRRGVVACGSPGIATPAAKLMLLWGKPLVVTNVMRLSGNLAARMARRTPPRRQF